MLNKYILLILILANSTIFAQYCSSSCIDYYGVCTGTQYSQCIICAQTIFAIIPVSGSCVPNNQTQIIAVDLQSPINLLGFTASTSTPYTCGIYQLSGQYTAGSYLTKTYSTVAAHYLLKLRFNIAFMGNWASTDILTVSVDSAPYSFPYVCGNKTNICTALNSGFDCVKIFEVNATHNTSSALVSFTTSINTPISTQSWGLKDLIVVLLTCNSKCNSCFGPASTQCMSCAQGFYLLGNVCTSSCPVYAVPDMNICTLSCPTGYFSDTTTSTCQQCNQGCQICSGPLTSNCILQQSVQSAWDRLKQFWIFLIVGGIVGLLVAIGCIIQKKRNQKLNNALKQPLQTNPVETLNNTQNEIKLDNSMANLNKLTFQNQLEVKTVKSKSNSDESQDNRKKKRKMRNGLREQEQLQYQ